MLDSHSQQDRQQRAQRLRDQIENLKTGQRRKPAGQPQSLREQIEERAEQIRREEERADR